MKSIISELTNSLIEINKSGKRLFLAAIVFIFTHSGVAQHNDIQGLWIVESVKVGDQVMTPNARWTRFNPDSTQESGNGRFQHSYGTYSLNQDTKKLTVTNSNGLADPFDPFTVHITDHTMTWFRMENGQKVEIALHRAQNLPETYGDKILGLWELEKAVGKNDLIQQYEESENKNYLFLKWDNRFLIGSAKEDIHGVYNVDGHNPTLEMIPYSEDRKRSFWKIDYEDEGFTLTLLNSENKITRKYKRIHEFPQ